MAIIECVCCGKELECHEDLLEIFAGKVVCCECGDEVDG
jgi:hypothetical protein